jgi:hypothetical protein
MNHNQDKKKKQSLTDIWNLIKTPEKADKLTEFKSAVQRLATQTDLGYTSTKDFEYPGSFLAMSDSSRVIPGYDEALKKRLGIGPRGPKDPTQKQLAENRYFTLRRLRSKGHKLTERQRAEFDDLHKYFGKKAQEEYDPEKKLGELTGKTLEIEGRLYETDPETGENFYKQKRENF